MGGKVKQSKQREFGLVKIKKLKYSILTKNFFDKNGYNNVWMSHSDQVTKLPKNFKVIASSGSSKLCMIENKKNNFFGIQFHPEVTHTKQGNTVIENFVLKVCNCNPAWKMDNLIEQRILDVKQMVGNQKVLLGLSGGVDSTVVAALIHKAIGDNLTCIFVDNGLMRKKEGERVKNIFAKELGVNLMYVDASERFVNALSGITDPETKRKIIGETFIKVFEEKAKIIGNVDYLAQGTLYPDVIESSNTNDTKAAHKIKTHHNVGGLPEKMNLKLIEPLKFLFKDEVRKAGAELGLKDQAINRQPFPGPGLAIRIIGDITKEKLQILQDVDWIVVNEIKKAGLYEKYWQSFAVLTDVKTVGVMGDKRTYQYVVAIRAITSTDAMTADWARMPYDTLANISNRIVNEVDEVNRVVYDITSKPPGTIEWE